MLKSRTADSKGIITGYKDQQEFFNFFFQFFSCVKKKEKKEGRVFQKTKTPTPVSILLFDRGFHTRPPFTDDKFFFVKSPPNIHPFLEFALTWDDEHF
jgi:hypothetical protein